MEKDTRTEFEKMEAGEMFWNSDAKIGELKKHARRLADRFNATTEDEDQLRLSLLKELFGDCDDDIFIKPPFHCDYGFHIHVGKISSPISSVSCWMQHRSPSVITV